MPIANSQKPIHPPGVQQPRPGLATLFVLPKPNQQPAAYSRPTSFDSSLVYFVSKIPISIQYHSVSQQKLQSILQIDGRHSSVNIKKQQAQPRVFAFEPTLNAFCHHVIGDASKGLHTDHPVYALLYKLS